MGEERCVLLNSLRCKTCLARGLLFPRPEAASQVLHRHCASKLPMYFVVSALVKGNTTQECVEGPLLSFSEHFAVFGQAEHNPTKESERERDGKAPYSAAPSESTKAYRPMCSESGAAIALVGRTPRSTCLVHWEGTAQIMPASSIHSQC